MHVDVRAQALERRVFDGDAARTAFFQDAADQIHRLREPTADEQAVGRTVAATRARQVARQRRAQHRGAAVIGVAKGVAPGSGHAAPQRRCPRAPRKAQRVRRAGAEIEARQLSSRLLRWRRFGDGDADAAAGHACARAAARNDPAFGQQLFVSLDDEAARQTDLAGERARGRQLHTDLQASFADRPAQLLFELRADRQAAAAIDAQQQVQALRGLHVATVLASLRLPITQARRAAGSPSGRPGRSAPTCARVRSSSHDRPRGAGPTSAGFAASAPQCRWQTPPCT